MLADDAPDVDAIIRYCASRTRRQLLIVHLRCRLLQLVNGSMQVPSDVRAVPCCRLYVPHPKCESTQREMLLQDETYVESAVVATTLQCVLDKLQILDAILRHHDSNEQLLLQNLYALLTANSEVELDVAASVASHPATLHIFIETLENWQASHAVKAAICDVLRLILDGADGCIISLKHGQTLLHALQTMHDMETLPKSTQLKVASTIARLSACDTLKAHGARQLVEHLQTWAENNAGHRTGEALQAEARMQEGDVRRGVST